MSLTVRDDGVGSADPESGSGLTGVSDRVDALGGTIEIHSPTGGRTTPRVRLPIARSSAITALKLPPTVRVTRAWASDGRWRR
jgi:glucose-6-phosphate-specific signal transduction histidine kinase